MKSIVVNEIFQDPESDSAKALSRDLRKLVSLEDVQHRIILGGLSSFRLARTKGEQRQIVKKLATEGHLNIVEVNAGMNLLEFLLNKVLDTEIPDDDYEKWADDFGEVSVLSDSEQKKVFKGLLESVQVIAVDQVEPVVKRRKAAQANGPFLEYFSVSAGILPVNEEKYKTFSFEDYEPKMVDTVAFATIFISIVEGPVKEIFFNAEEDSIDMMIDSLRAAKKDMAALRKFLKI